MVTYLTYHLGGGDGGQGFRSFMINGISAKNHYSMRNTFWKTDLILNVIIIHTYIMKIRPGYLGLRKWYFVYQVTVNGKCNVIDMYPLKSNNHQTLSLIWVK